MVAILSGKNPTGVMIFFPSPNTPPAQGGAVVGAAGVDGVHVRHQNLAENSFKADVDIWDGRASPLSIAVKRKIQSGFGKKSPCSLRRPCHGPRPARSVHHTHLQMTRVTGNLTNKQTKNCIKLNI